MNIEHPWYLLRDQAVTDGARPLVTYVGAEGRTELSVRSLANNVAKGAGLLRDDLDIAPGDTVRLALPVHWQTAVWLGACWAVGAVAQLGEAVGGAVTVATAERLPDSAATGDVLRVGRHPFGLPSDDPLPPGVLEAATEVRSHPDVFVPDDPPAADDPALADGPVALTHAEVLADATRLAGTLGVPTGGRLLVTSASLDLVTAPALLALPLVIRGSVVLAPGSADRLAELVAAERTDAHLP